MMLGRLATPAAPRCSRPGPSRSSSTSLAGAHSRGAAALAPAPHVQRRRCRLAATDDEAAGEAAAAAQQPSTPDSTSSSRGGGNSSSAAKDLVESLPKAFVSEDEWRQMDKKVNKYPCQRTFTAIGTGGDDFKAAMTAAVEGVVGKVHLECVSARPSSGGKYTSVRVGPVWVEDPEQVIQVFSTMRKDERLKWYM